MVKKRKIKLGKTAKNVKKLQKQLHRELKAWKKKASPKKIRTTAQKIRKSGKIYLAKTKTPLIRFLTNPKLWYLTFTTVFLFTLTATSFYVFILKDLPPPSSLNQIESAQTTIIRDRNGQVLYKIYKDVNRIKLPWEEIPDNIKYATIAIEDSDFYTHHGISVKAIVRAFINNFHEKDINLYQGASTITQQLIKNRIVGFEKTYFRKIREISLALWTETQFSKNDILSMYLNEVGYGGTAYGIQAASQMYFGIDASMLTLAQAALLAGLPKAPTVFSPFGSNAELAQIRQGEVLERMLKLEMIDRNQYNSALSEELVFAPPRIEIAAPHFVMFVRDQLVQKLGEEKVSRGGLNISTTLDLNIQRMAESVVRNRISEIKNTFNIHNGAALITNPRNGEILAMVGSANYFDLVNNGHVNVTTSKRQPGSAIKAVNYAYLFDHGFTPGSTIEDSPVTYVAPGSTETYTPVNYDGKFHGTVTLRSALANSYNVPAVKLLNSYGADKMIQLGKKMGIKSWYEKPQAGLSLTLGGAEVTMLDMTRAYQSIANLGVRNELAFIKEIRDSNGTDLTANLNQPENDVPFVDSVQASENQQVISPMTAYWLTDILSDEKARLPAFGRFAKLTVPGYKIAVKTGTSNNFRDNWTIGFTPSYLTAVWVGNNDGSFMNKNLVSGITGAAPIWNEIMTNLLNGTLPEDFPIPSGLIPVKICAVNGLLTCPFCPSEKIEYYTADKVPTRQCHFKSPQECKEAKTRSEGKSDEEKKQILSGCSITN